MIYDPNLHALYTNDGTFLKTVYCPKAIKIRDLQPINKDGSRACLSCGSEVVHIGDMSDEEAIELLNTEDREPPCVFAGPAAKNVVFLRHRSQHYEPNPGLPVIRTARSIGEMQDGWRDGFIISIHACGVVPDFGDHMAVYQNKITGEIKVTWDMRWYPGAFESSDEQPNPWSLAIDWFRYRTDLPFPLAAYLIPRDLAPGTQVYLEDVIVDAKVVFGPQGYAQRLNSCAATWTGTSFELVMPNIFPCVG